MSLPNPPGETQVRKKKTQKPGDKMKFQFDWGAEEDTSRDLNPLYQTPHGMRACVVVVGWGGDEVDGGE